MIAPIMEELSKEYAGKAVVVKCDVDNNPQVSAKYGIRNIPTVLFFKDGKIADKQVGAVPKPNFVNKLNALL
jgi:thioredoxin 1